MIVVIGMGTAPMTPAAIERVEGAQLVVGSTRHLSLVRARNTLTYGVGMDRLFDAVSRATGDVVVLASGDPGFFGIVRVLAGRFGGDRLEVHPAPSSISMLTARLGIPWDDAVIVSAHGREPRYAVNACRAHPKVAVFTSPDLTPSDLACGLAGLKRTCVVGERLGDPDERIVVSPVEALRDMECSDPNVVLVMDEDRLGSEMQHLWPVRQVPPSWGLPERLFECDGSLITKAEVRALALARLGPGIGDLIWDVGAGSGSVGIECARFGAAVVAIEQDADRCRQISDNAQHHRAEVNVVCGAAPSALAVLDDPDAVFVGGGGGALEDILSVVAARARRTVVVALTGVERVGSVVGWMSRAGLEVDSSLIQVARFQPLAGVHRLVPINPVVLVTGRRS